MRYFVKILSVADHYEGVIYDGVSHGETFLPSIELGRDAEIQLSK